jgi:hypothetical protein
MHSDDFFCRSLKLSNFARYHFTILQLVIQTLFDKNLPLDKMYAIENEVAFGSVSIIGR